jgi:hypothetical protein
VLLVFVSQGISLATGRDLILDKLGISSSAAANPLVRALVDDAYGTLQSRAMVGIVLAVISLIFTVLALRGGIGPRITLTVFLLLTAGLMIISVKDVFPSMSKATGTVAIILAPVAIILMFLPAVNEYAKSRKAPRMA